MKTLYSLLALSFCSALLTCGGDVEKEHLKLYASFDNSAKPEISMDGSGFRSAGKLFFTEGKSGKALRFSRKSEVGDLLYNLGTTMNGKEWSIAMWICPEERPKKNGEVPGRNLFRTNFGWGSGNVFAGFDNWGRFILNHFDAEKKFRREIKTAGESGACRCGDVICGRIRPEDCPLFDRRCTPEEPVGPCMVSSEGACAAAYMACGSSLP